MSDSQYNLKWQKCLRCKEKTPYQDVIDGNFKTCPKCGYSYRVSIGAEFSPAMDSYAEGAISADEVVQASFDQNFAEITRKIDPEKGASK